MLTFQQIILKLQSYWDAQGCALLQPYDMEVVARQLLPLFEAEPSGWESLSFFNLTPNRKADKTLPEHFKDWLAVSPKAHHGFLRKLAAAFGQ